MFKIILFVISICPTLAHSENHHDHLEYLPTQNSFKSVLSEIGSIKVSNFSMARNIDAWSLQLNISQNKMTKSLSDSETTIADLAESLGLSLENFVKKASSMNNQVADANKTEISGVPTQIRKSYQTATSFRNDLLLNISSEGFTTIIKETFKITSIMDTKELKLSVSPRFFRSDQIAKVYTLKRQSFAHGHSIKIYQSISRRTMVIDSNNDPKLPIRYADLIDGIDLTGSLFDRSNLYSVIKFQKGLERLFQISSHNDTGLRVHAYESTRTGKFYRALNNLLQSYESKLKLSIGHISALSKVDIDLFASLPRNIELDVNANIATNIVTGSSKIKKIEENLLYLEKKHIPITWGSDGLNLVPGSHFIEQMSLLIKNGEHKRHWLRELYKKTGFKNTCKILSSGNELPKFLGKYF